MKITIHRGIDQIGGCITEIASATRKILIDLGHNLPKGDNYSADSNANKEAIDKLTAGVSAIFYTHYHGDHVDLFKYVPDRVAQYIGEAAKQVMICKYEILAASKKVEGVSPEDLRKLKTFKTFHPLEKIHIGDITVTPFFVSHSACDSYMFLIEADGKRLLHTGDFREHGYLGKGLMPTIEKYITPKQIDVLITEGTMLSRIGENVPTESDLQKTANELMKQYKYVFALCSSTDIDRLATFYNASQQCGRSFLCDGYQKQVLDIFAATSGMKSDLYKFDNARFCKQGHVKQFELIKDQGFCMLIRSSQTEKVKALLAQLPKDETLLIYSMWSGYIKDGENQKNDYLDLYNLFTNRVSLHTSGHASPETLAKVCNTVNPATAIIPIHSECSREFANLDISVELKLKIVTSSITKDGIVIKI